METAETVRRVALVSPAWPPGTAANGISTYVQYLRAGLNELGVECRVAAPFRSPGGEDAHPISGSLSQSSAVARYATRVSRRLFPRLAARLVPALDAMDGFRRLEREWPFDVLETEETFGTARWIARAVRAPVVVRLHGPWCVNGPARGERRGAAFDARVAAEGRAIARAAAVSAPSRDVLERVRRHYGQALPDAVVIPNPGPEPDPSETWSPAHAEPGLVLFVGRFDRHKGGDLVVDAFARLAERIPSLRLVIAGSDDGVADESGRLRLFPEYAAAKVPERHRNRIECLGRVNQATLVAWRRRAAVVVSASRYENFAMAVLEALAQGCPVVCPDAGGFPEMVEDGVSGSVYPSGDVPALAGRIESLINAPARAAELGRQALLQYRARYLPRQVARRTVEFYSDVCRSGRAARTRARV